MTKEEIKSLVAAKIAGQGTNVDAASVLPSIIEGILDLIPEAPVQADLTVTDPTSPAYVKTSEFSATDLSSGKILLPEEAERLQALSPLLSMVDQDGKRVCLYSSVSWLKESELSMISTAASMSACAHFWGSINFEDDYVSFAEGVGLFEDSEGNYILKEFTE